MTKGYISVVQNNSEVNYLQLAYCLALSIKNTQSKINNFSIVTDIKDIPQKYLEVFDHVIPIKEDRAYDNEWKLDNIVDLYDYSPYDETVMLDSDMLFLDDVSYWWDLLQERELWFTTNIRTYQNIASPPNTIYRQEHIKNNLPSVYNAFFYFKKCEAAEDLFKMMKLIYENWDYHCDQHLSTLRPTIFSTDVAFGLALKLLGFSEIATFPEVSFPHFTHMKTQNQGWDLTGLNMSENWTAYTSVSFDEFNGSLGVKIGTIRQFGVLHYHVKTFLNNRMIEILENANS